MSIASIDIPFEQCDADSASVDSTGAAASALFTNLAGTKQRQILLRNDGMTNVLLGKSLAAARFPILPGDALLLAAKDLAKLFLKSASGSNTVVIFQVL